MIPETGSVQSVSSFSDEVDVLVVGLGMAGGCAAVEAAAAGARVLVLERAAVAGGTTAMAGGHFYLNEHLPQLARWVEERVLAHCAGS